MNRPGDRTVRAVLAVTAGALVARFISLGARVAHFDEARVGYWILEYARTGEYSYRPIVHGPFLQHVNRLVFDLLGPTDFAMRLAPALVGGLLPLVALLFRDRLRERELLALALMLAAAPVLLYYSRFMRGDVLVGAFCVAAFGLLVRAFDTGRAWYVAPAIALLGFGLTVKENALIYPLLWLLAALVLVDYRLLDGDDPGEMLRDLPGRLRRAVVTVAAPVVVGLVLALVIVVAFYAPRSPAPGAVSLGNALADPTLWPALLRRATVDVAGKMAGLWFAPNDALKREFSYLAALGAMLKDVGLGALGVSLLALVGGLADRYGGEPRALVQHAFFWGLGSVLVYPAVTDIPAPWLAVHVVLPLSIPAAVGAVRLVNLVREDREAGNGGRLPTTTRARIALVALVLVVGQIGGVALYTSYAAPEGPNNELAQYAQPSGDLRATVDGMGRLADGRDGPHVLVYGEFYVDGDADVPRRPACVRWFRTLPLPWYAERDDVEVVCARDTVQLPDEMPPVVVTDGTGPVPSELATRTAGYDRRTADLRQDDRSTLFLVDTESIPER